MGTRILHIRAPAAPSPLAIGPISRLIEEEHRVQVFVRDSNVDQALKVLKKKMQRDGVFREMRLRKHYEKPSERRVQEKAEAVRRARKLARKKLQRGPAADEAPGGPRGFRKKRPTTRTPFLILEQCHAR